MFFIGKQFIRPSKKLRILALLQALSENTRLSQSRLSAFCHTSSAMVHQYLADLHQNGSVEFLPVDKKSYQYSLTEQGSNSRQALMEAYCTEMVQAYASIKHLIRRRLARLETTGVQRLALFGAAETGELVLTALEESPFVVCGVLDNDPRKQGTRFRNHTVLAPEALETLNAEAIVITSFAQQDAIFAQLSAMPAVADKEIMRL